MAAAKNEERCSQECPDVGVARIARMAWVARMARMVGGGNCSALVSMTAASALLQLPTKVRVISDMNSVCHTHIHTYIVCQQGSGGGDVGGVAVCYKYEYNKSSIWRYKVCKKKIYLQRQNM